MARYNELPVYKASYDLLLEIFVFTKDLRKEYKYTIGEKVKERVFEVLLGVYRANNSRNREESLAKTLEDVEYIRLSLRLLRDLRVLNDEKYARLVVLCEDVAVQLEKWMKYESGRNHSVRCLRD